MIIVHSGLTLFMAKGRGLGGRGGGLNYQNQGWVGMCFKYIEFFWGDNFWNNVVSTLSLVLPFCTEVFKNSISSTGREEPGSAVSLFADPLFSFQRSSNARLKNIKTTWDLWTID